MQNTLLTPPPKTARASLRDIGRLMTRRSRSGQSIIIIALGFIVLIAFVGIATDAALLFVRFSTLRRAVDAAAVAAAGQVRENTTYAQVAAAATQYIRLHGLDPASVKVETCETEIEDHKRPPFNMSDAVPGTIRTYLASSTAGVPNSELCRKDPAKLVRVSAQIISPTTFLSIIGYRSIILSGSSISQTAVMDVVLMLDGSLSMGADTFNTQAAFAREVGATQATVDTKLDSMVGFVTGQIDPLINPDQGGFTLGLGSYKRSDLNYPSHVDGTFTSWRGVVYPAYANDGRATITPGNEKGTVRAECRAPDIGSPISGFQTANYAYGGCCNDPTTQSNPGAGNTDYNWYIDARTGMINVSGAKANLVSGVADLNYSDLVCRPFKDVRDATRRFLLKVDFTRGDRVILIQFDAKANPITSGGVYAEGGSLSPVFITKYDAITALNKYIGIEPNPNGKQTGCTTLFNRNVGNGLPYDVGEYFYENIAPCPDTNTGAAVQSAASLLTDPRWVRRDAVWISVLLSDGYPNRTPGIGLPGAVGLGGVPYADSVPVVAGETWNPNIHIVPNNPAALYISNGVAQGGPTNLSGERFFDNPIPIQLTDPGFCPWATICDPSAGSQSTDGIDYSNSRTVAGEINPIYPPLRDPDLTPLNSVEWNNRYCDPAKSNARPIWWDMLTKPGADPNWHEGGSPSGLRVPLCADNNPDSRHFCVDPLNGNLRPGRPNDLCSEFYDADDFARDRVDFAALIDWTPKLKGNFIAMFSIFFPHRVTTAGGSATTYTNENILGVKFMRYMADAGDNGVIDNSLQRWYRDQAYGPTYYKEPDPPGSSRADDAIGFKSSLLPTQYTDRSDPCDVYNFREGIPQLPGSLAFPNTTYEDLITKSCGNYYYAGDRTSIDRAFTDIASRLFTRLAR